ncbi:LysR family transcriptional regulator [Streptomyces barkulensis]|uniref:LysR family transcriptional regulator n=2 Tax=Streptomyces barkulensis TaxID=1257026 RepID=UPI000C6D3522|nr:LysR family transcriptional regulator [Streptomyces barkulensis]
MTAVDVEIQDLRVLRAVADTGSLAGAARALGLSQAGVSRRIQRAERATGLVVLRRDHRGALLTAAGRLLLDCADELLPVVDRLLAAGAHGDPPGPAAERLRIGAVPHPALPLVTARARALLPSAAVEVRTVDCGAVDCGAALPDLFRLHRLDLVVFRHFPQLDGPLPDTLGTAVLAEESLLVRTAADHRPAERASVSLFDIDGRTCLLPAGRRHAALHHRFMTAVRRRGVHVEVRWAADEAEAAALACATGGVLPAYPLPAPAAGMVCLPLDDDAVRHRLLLAWRPGDRAAAWAHRLAGAVRESYTGGGAGGI